jgi:hypothetical protein
MFRDTVARWLDADTELLVLNRLTRAAGRKDWYLVRSRADLDLVVGGASTSDCLTVFSGNHLGYRLRADDDALRLALALVERSEESLFGEIVSGEAKLRDAFAAVPGDEGWVEDWIREHWLADIAFGPYPPFLSNDPAMAIDGIVPSADGTVTPGVY